MTWIFFVMVAIQCVAYLWFQSRGGVVSHRKYIFVHACLMIGQSAQSLESFSKGGLCQFFGCNFLCHRNRLWHCPKDYHDKKAKIG